MRKPPNVSALRQSKRKRPNTPVKKRNIKYKPAPKQEILNCAVCEFTAGNNVKLKKHMKSYHTEPIIKDTALAINESVRTQNVEDMSVCAVSGSEEEVMTEITACTKCNFEASTEEELEKHLDEVHSKIVLKTLDEETVPSDRVKSIPLIQM